MSQITLKDMAAKPDLLCPGARLCAGCDESIIVRMVLKATRGPTIVTNATGCLEVATSIFPYTSWDLPWIHSAFENTAATASGIEAAYKAMRKRGEGPLAKYPQLDVIAFAGDGGTYDIGLQALSGAMERGHDFTYVLLDNEAYMNTGIQRSSATPYGAWTTTTPVKFFKNQPKKDINAIMAAHRIPYQATASISYPEDLFKKAKKAKDIKGTRFLHIYAPCPTGWKSQPEDAVKLGRMVIQNCIFPLYEIEYGEKYTLNIKVKDKKPINDYLKLQGRFRHLKPDEIQTMQEEVDRNWARLLKKCEGS